MMTRRDAHQVPALTRSALSRRRFLQAGGLGLSAAALAACSGPLTSGITGGAPNADGVTYWNLFSGGDGGNMIKMEDAYRKAHPNTKLDATVLAWGNPYYTKLSLATTGGQPPDLAISHLSRMPLLAQAGILSDLGQFKLGDYGITEDKFTPAAWKKAQIGGTQYAIPLDTHLFVLYYNVDLAKKAGLIGSDGNLVDISGKENFIKALQAMKKVTGAYGGVVNINADPATNYRWFDTLYGQLGGTVVADDGTKVTLDQDKVMTVLDFMGSLTNSLGLMPNTIDGASTTQLFSTGKAGFLLDGNWQITTYQAVKGFNFNMIPIPPLLSSTKVAYADSHSFVIPNDPNRPEERTRNAITLMKTLLNNSITWAQGGHVPAWLPVQQGSEFKKLKPQSNYASAAFDAIYDPNGWYTGAGSDYQTLMGSAVANVQAGGAGHAKSAYSDMMSGLKRYAATKSPVN